MIHIGRAGSKLGSFSEVEIRQGLATGRFSPTDLGWKEGMENWAPLSQFPEFEPAPPPTADEQAREAGVIETRLGTGLPWDEWRERGVLIAFAQTARLVLTNPTEAFSRMRSEGSLSGPLCYNLFGGWLGLIASGIYAVLITKFMPPPADSGMMQGRYTLTPAMAVMALKMFIWMGPLIVTLRTLVLAAIAHVFLVLAGGTRRAFHVTLRVVCFGYGSTELLQFLPFCGGLLALGWMIVCWVTGQAIAHGTSVGRSIAAMVLAMAVCFAGCLGILSMAESVLGR